MRKSLGTATFLALGLSTVAVSAVSTVSADGKLHLKGSDTLKVITTNVINNCVTDAIDSIVYDGTGSSNGQNAINPANDTQQIAPMSRPLNSSGCSVAGVADVAEGIVIGLDGLSILASQAVADACSAGSEDCNAANDPAGSGLATNKSFNVGLACTVTADCNDNTLTCNAGQCQYTLGSDTSPGTAFAGTANDWQDALRLIYAGMDQNDGNNIANRDCNSLKRVALVNTWSNMFQNGCTVSGCTELRHAFRRDDESGTTDTFVSLLNLPSINFTSNVVPFCNSIQSDQDNPANISCTKDADCPSFDCNEATPVPPENIPGNGKCRKPAKPYYPEFQDNDPIRRACAGTGLGAEGTNTPTEQVCDRLGTLGLVLPINPPPTGVGGQEAPTTYPTKSCAPGLFALAPAIVVEERADVTIYDRCPNGDRTFFNSCLWPVSSDLDPACINDKDNMTSFRLDTQNSVGPASPLHDGRVYNRYLRKGNAATNPNVNKFKMATIARPNNPAAEIVGAFYRLHTTRSMTENNTLNLCNTLGDATQQLGCLVIASPCSMAYAGNEADNVFTANAAGSGDDGHNAALDLNGLEPSDSCVRKLILPGSGAPYPLARKLYVNSMDGFETLSTTSLASPHSELELAKCFSQDGLVHTIVKNAGFVTLGDVTGQPGACSNDASLFCEKQCPAGVGDPCANNPSGIVSGTSPVDLAANWTPNAGSCP